MNFFWILAFLILCGGCSPTQGHSRRGRIPSESDSEDLDNPGSRELSSSSPGVVSQSVQRSRQMNARSSSNTSRSIQSPNTPRYNLRPRQDVSYICTRVLSESGSPSERCFFVPPDVGAHDSDSSYAPTEDEQDPPGGQAGALNSFEHGLQPKSFQDWLP